MRINKNYEKMTDAELFNELDHRLSTFGETLGDYESGGIKVNYKSQTLGNKDYWVQYLDRSEHWICIFLVEDTQGINSNDDTPLIVFEDNPQFRDILLQGLKNKYQFYQNSEFKEEVDQQEQLKDRKCKICRENNIPDSSEFLEPLRGPLSGHFDTDF